MTVFLPFSFNLFVTLMCIKDSPEAETPALLKSTLLPFQRKALHWMLQRENGLHGWNRRIRVNLTQFIAAEQNKPRDVLHPFWCTAYRLPAPPKKRKLPPIFQDEILFCNVAARAPCLARFTAPGLLSSTICDLIAYLCARARRKRAWRMPIE